MEGKIALEEHFSTPLNNSKWDAKGEETRNGREYTKDIERRLLSPDLCLREMDLAGIEFCVMSLTSPGAQSVIDKHEAAKVAQGANDYAAGFIKGHPDRFSAFAAVALQDPRTAADELERAVSDLGFKGALINGYSNVGADEAIVYLDEQPMWEFWERVPVERAGVSAPARAAVQPDARHTRLPRTGRLRVGIHVRDGKPRDPADAFRPV